MTLVTYYHFFRSERTYWGRETSVCLSVCQTPSPLDPEAEETFIPAYANKKNKLFLVDLTWRNNYSAKHKNVFAILGSVTIEKEAFNYRNNKFNCFC